MWRSHLQTAYLLTPTDSPPEGHRHVFCGSHATPGARCPNCDKPLLRLAQLDPGDARLGRLHTQAPSLSLYFCWTCNIAQKPFSYRLEQDGRVRLLSYGRGGVTRHFPYDDYPLSFPERGLTLDPLPPEVQDQLRYVNAGEHLDDLLGCESHPALCGPHHQLGGVPFLEQRVSKLPACPGCRAPMPFLASIADDNADYRGFTDNPYVQILYFLCGPCATVTCWQQCGLEAPLD